MYTKFVQVIINNNSKSTDNLYTYGVPDKFLEDIMVGKRVKITFSNTKKTVDALVVGIISDTDVPIEKIKPILDIIDDVVIVKPELIKLANWIRERYICKYSDVIRLMVPSQIKYEHDKETKIKKEKIIYLIDKTKPIDEYNLKNASKQIKAIEYLKNVENILLKDLTSSTDITSATVNTLIKKNIIGVEEKLYLDDETHDDNLSLNKLNNEQKKCYDEIINSNDIAYLLHGITGSGKTEVYIKLINYYKNLGKQSIMLVPEISLTNQIVDRFKKSFGNRIAVFHSKLTAKQRYIEWYKVINKEVDVVIGARSALFAPITNLGIIIVDEEHEDSYKSSTSPKYDAVETAIKRAYIENCKIVLGSATPSLKTFNMAINGRIKLLEMKSRANHANLPEIKIIDMKEEIESGNDTILSRDLYRSIRRSLRNNEQVILFVNRRGYSNFISCKKCGYVVKCDKCDVSMTYHMNTNKLKCHYCGRTKFVFDKCPECGSEKIQQFGFGTQQAEEFIKGLFKDYNVARMDMDSMSAKDSYETIYNDFKEHKIDILIGTQMLAKGLDFPDVTTVGILSADSLINLPFYNSGEKTFQLLTQVSGRAGRSNKKGYVFIQTYEPENFIVNAAKSNDFNVFIKEESMLRKEFAYPPYINIINICTISKFEDDLKKVSFERYEVLKQKIQETLKGKGVLLYNPTPHSIYKVNNEYRINLFIKVSLKYTSELKNIIREVYMEKDIKNIKISINIDTENV